MLVTRRQRSRRHLLEIDTVNDVIFKDGMLSSIRYSYLLNKMFPIFALRTNIRHSNEENTLILQNEMSHAVQKECWMSDDSLFLGGSLM